MPASTNERSQILEAELGFALSKIDTRIYDRGRDTLLVNASTHRPARKHMIVPGNLVTNASPGGSSSDGDYYTDPNLARLVSLREPPIPAKA